MSSPVGGVNPLQYTDPSQVSSTTTTNSVSGAAALNPKVAVANVELKATEALQAVQPTGNTTTLNPVNNNNAANNNNPAVSDAAAAHARRNLGNLPNKI